MKRVMRRSHALLLATCVGSLAMPGCKAGAGSGVSFGSAPPSQPSKSQAAGDADVITVTRLKVGKGTCTAPSGASIVSLSVLRTHDQVLSDYSLVGMDVKGMTAGTAADWEMTEGSLYISARGNAGASYYPYHWVWRVILVHNVVIGADARHAVIQSTSDPASGDAKLRIICVDVDTLGKGDLLIASKDNPASRLQFNGKDLELRRMECAEIDPAANPPKVLSVETLAASDPRWIEAIDLQKLATCLQFNDPIITRAKTNAGKAGSENP